MKRKKTHLFILIICLCLSSCTREVFSDDNSSSIERGEAPYLAINLKTNDSSSEDDQIAKIRTIVVNDADQIITNTVFIPDAPVDENFRLIAKANFGKCTVHVICNETNELAQKLSNLNYGNEIEAINYSTNNLTAPLTMYAKVSNIRIDYDKNAKKTQIFQDGNPVNVVSATVIRTMAKLSFVAIKNIDGGEKFSIESLSFQVCQMPRHSHLTEDQTYTPSEGWANNVAVKGEGNISLEGKGEYIEAGDGYEVSPTTAERITAPSVYIPGHLLENEADNVNCTYLLVEAKCKREGSSTLINAKYRIDLGKNPPINYTLSRNIHYRVYVTIKSMGATGIYAEIVPLKEYNTPIVWKTLEGYTIMGECLTEHDNDIWNNYSQYSGILKIKDQNGKYNNALFRYGSIIALNATTADFTPTSTVLWRPAITIPSGITNWNDLAYLAKEQNVFDDNVHNSANIALGKGDPCKLVGLTNGQISTGTIDNETWRMPTAEEMNWLLNAKSSTNNSKGFYSYNYLVTPNIGFRKTDGVLETAASKGYYWSSTGAKAFIFNSADNTGSIVEDDPQKAYAIRCIRTFIPRSRLSVSEATIDYNGKIDIPLELNDLFLTPYWKMEALPPTEGIHITKNEGIYNEQALVTVSPSSTPYESHLFKIKVTGYGLDGNTNIFETRIRQVALSHSITLHLDSPSNLPTSGGYIRVPKEGGTLGFKIDVSPALQPPYDASIIGNWRVEVSYYDTKPQIILGNETSIGGTSTIEIPKNEYGHSIALYFEMKPVDKTKFPPYTSGKTIFIHEHQ